MHPITRIRKGSGRLLLCLGFMFSVVLLYSTRPSSSWQMISAAFHADTFCSESFRAVFRNQKHPVPSTYIVYVRGRQPFMYNVPRLHRTQPCNPMVL